MKPPRPTRFAALISPLFCGGLVVGLLVTLTVAAWPAILSQPLAMFDSLWNIQFSKDIYYGYGGFLAASLFTGVLGTVVVLVLSWLGALGLRRVSGGSWLGHVLIDVLHVLGAIPPVAIGGAVALWLLPALAQTAGYSGRCYLLGIVALVGIHWPRLTLEWVRLQDSFSPDLMANARALGASRWQVLRWVKWPATKHRVVELGLQTLVRCLGEAAGIFFVCGASGQTLFHVDLLGNTDTMATRLLASDAAWHGPDRAALIMVTLALALLCLAISSLGWRIGRTQTVLPPQPSPHRMHPAGFAAVVLLIMVLPCYLVPLLLAGNVAMEGTSTVGAGTVVAFAWKWLLLVLLSTLTAFLLAFRTSRQRHSASSMRWLQGCPPIVWAVAFGCLLPYGYRSIGLVPALDAGSMAVADLAVRRSIQRWAGTSSFETTTAATVPCRADVDGPGRG